MQNDASAAPDLPELVSAVLDEFVAATRKAFEADLRSVVLFGSGAEGRLRETSDINIIVVLTTYDPAKAERLREALRVAHAAVNLSAMFLRMDEVADASEAFAQKFADVSRRHRVLFGEDPFAAVVIPRDALIRRLNQVLLNLTLRLRAAYIERGLREEQLAGTIAEVSGPLRTCAASLLELEGDSSESPRVALRRFADSLGEPGWDAVLENISRVRETGSLSRGVAEETLIRQIDLLQRMRARALVLR
jgi:predicted nucleotidyltransferase